MNAERNNKNIVFIGRYGEGEILSGPELAAKRLFEEECSLKKTVFIQYFFDGKKYGRFKKLFGQEKKEPVQNGTLITCGLIRLLFVLMKLKPDIIHIVTFERFAKAALIYASFSKVRILYTCHGVIIHEDDAIKSLPESYKKKNKAAELKFMNRSDTIIFPSRFAESTASKYYQIDKNKTVIIPNSVSESFHIVSLKRVTNENDPLRAVVMNLNRFADSGVKFVQKIGSSLSFPIDLYILGRQAEIKSNKVNIITVEPMNHGDLPEFFRNKDIFFALNSYDTFSISCAEAMATGMVPIVTSQTGISQHIIDGTNGYVLEYGDAVKAESVLNGLDRDRAKLKSVTAEAVKIFGELNMPRIAWAYNKLYRGSL